MDKKDIEEYKRQLKIIESEMTDETIKKMKPEELQEYIVLASQIKARLKLLESLS